MSQGRRCNGSKVHPLPFSNVYEVSIVVFSCHYENGKMVGLGGGGEFFILFMYVCIYGKEMPQWFLFYHQHQSFSAKSNQHECHQ
mmetsp:Transcript_1461/g.2673  ORF Transcript_1461/g.2673 Transcript_1461/m.2673 type:complete len:85 (-) Transcript_1461:73-327(-)